MNNQLAKNEIFIRWLINKDIAEVQKIENENFMYPWNTEDFRLALKAENVIGLVATNNEQVIGYIIYKLDENKYNIINMAVAINYQRQRIGTMLLNKILRRLKPDNRTKVSVLVSETNVMAQLFLKKQEFKYIKTIKNYYEYSDLDAYVMEFNLWDIYSE